MLDAGESPLFLQIPFADQCYIPYDIIYYIIVMISKFLLSYVHIRITSFLHCRCYILIRLCK